MNLLLNLRPKNSGNVRVLRLRSILRVLLPKKTKAMNIPIINRSLMDKEELLADIEDIRLQLPEELKQARWMKEERKKINKLICALVNGKDENGDSIDSKYLAMNYIGYIVVLTSYRLYVNINYCSQMCYCSFKN